MSYVTTLDRTIPILSTLMSYVFEFSHFLETTRIQIAGPPPLFDPSATYMEEELRVFRDWIQQQGKLWEIPRMRVHVIFSPDRDQVREDWKPPLSKWARDLLPAAALSQLNPKYRVELPCGTIIRKRGPQHLETTADSVRRARRR